MLRVRDTDHSPSYMVKQLKNIKSTLENIYTEYFNTGKYKGTSMQSLFQDGAWVDAQAIGVFNVNTSMINNAMESMVNAIALDWAWSHQRVWLMSYPMSQDDCTFHCIRSAEFAQCS